MLFKALLFFGLVHVTHSGIWLNVGQACIGAKDNSYKEMVFNGPSVFVGAVKLEHTSGYVSCSTSQRNSFWGCSTDKWLNIIITDTENRVLYPSPSLAEISKTGRYTMAGYNAVSPELIFSDFCHPQYFKKGRQLRIWYGEDLKGYTESDNHGKTCMYVYFYMLA